MDEPQTIALRRSNGSIRAWAVVDAEDHASLAAEPWHVSSLGYAASGKSNSILMHRVVMGLRVGDPRHVDHINRDRLDNRKANLRFATPSEQAQNRTSRGNSRFRGVCWDKSKKRWIASATLNGVQHRFGRFKDEVEAVRVVDAWRLENMPYAQPDPELVKLDAA